MREVVVVFGVVTEGEELFQEVAAEVNEVLRAQETRAEMADVAVQHEGASNRALARLRRSLVSAQCVCDTIQS